MSQAIFSNIVPATTSGNQLATLLNEFKNAIVSGLSGTSRPSALQAGGAWVDTANDGLGTWDYKIYTGTEDIVLMTINKNTQTAYIASAENLFKIEKISADTVGPILSLVKKRIATNGQTLSGDSVGEIHFKGYTDAGVVETIAKIAAISNDNVSALTQGSYLVFEVTENNTAAIVEAMRLIDNKLGIGTPAPEETLHVKGTGVKVEKSSDDAVGAKVILKKKRISGVGQVQLSDVVAGLDFVSTDDAGSELVGAKIEVVATENHTSTAHGSKISISTKKVGQVVHTEQISIEDTVKVKTKLTAEGDLEVVGNSQLTGNVTVTGNFTVSGTTTTVNSSTLEVTDPNITVNNGGTQATANTNKSGFLVEMSDATHAQIGYDSTKASKFVVGNVGSEKEIVDVSSVQTLTNKVISATQITEDSTHRFVTDAEKASWAAIPASVSIPALEINWTSGNVFYKNVAANSTFTFSNVTDGKVISVIVANTSGSGVTLTLPTGLYKASVDLVVEAGKENVYTFIRSNGKTYVTNATKLTNA